jgi:hypothetical protein
MTYQGLNQEFYTDNHSILFHATDRPSLRAELSYALQAAAAYSRLLSLSLSYGGRGRPLVRSRASTSHWPTVFLALSGQRRERVVGDPVPSPATWAPLHPIRSRRGSALGRSRILAGVNTVDPSQSYRTP